jgi:Ca-activated chloride channel homolog
VQFRFAKNGSLGGSLMYRWSFITLLILAVAPIAFGRGLLVPEDVKLPPLAMVHHRVNATLEDQVATTTIEQAFRNYTDRDLEATYLFPVPKGANVNKFTMWIDGKETSGELLDSKKANDVYTSIVRRTQDPALLEYIGSGLMRLRVFPIPPHKGSSSNDVKIKLSYTALMQKDVGIVEFVYPLKTDGKGTRTLEEFAVKLSIQSQVPIHSVYSPTHAIEIKRKSDKQVEVDFSKNQAALDKDFQLFYATSTADIGLTPVLYRPVSSEDGYFMLLVSPQTEATKDKRVARDLVLVLDTSGSMSEVKMSQVKQAVRLCLKQLNEKDRFGLIAFSTGVRTYQDSLADAVPDQIEKAMKWVDDLRAGGGTAILPALTTAMGLRSKDITRNFNVTFFTDGQATVDETNPQKIVKAITEKNSANTRIFTFGVGDDVNAAMLDQLADATRAISTYVRPAEDIEAKASALFAKISHPVMTNVKLSSTKIKIHEIYPLQLPDLFYGGQLVLFGRYSGSGQTAIKLSGLIGSEERELVYETSFPAKTENGREFVENLWARRKVGFILDQIRVNGESKELVEEVTGMAKRYGIATPYTSYLVVPDTMMPIVRGANDGMPPASKTAMAPAGLAGGGAGGGPGGAPGGFGRVSDFARKLAESDSKKADGIAGSRRGVQDKLIQDELTKLKPDDRAKEYAKSLEKAEGEAKNLSEAKSNFRNGNAGLKQNQAGRLGVELATASNALRAQERLTQTSNKQVQGRNCIEIGGVWIDDQFEAKTATVVVKAQSDAYFAILAKQPKVKEVYLLGNHFVWVTPSGTALVVDGNDGKEKLDDKEIEALFTAK